MPQLYIIVCNNKSQLSSVEYSSWITDKKTEVCDRLEKGARAFLFPQMTEVTSAEVVITPGV